MGFSNARLERVEGSGPFETEPSELPPVPEIESAFFSS